MKLKGAQIFFECLKKEGVEVVFGFPGGAVLDIYHEMAAHNIRHILVRHEQGAAHMADGYARASGRVGVCLVTSGPGATNTVTGIATAYMDSVPMVVFTGQVPTPLIGDDAFQEVDIMGITRPCTKHSYLVRDVKDLAPAIKEAFYLARTGRPGPILVDLPKDVIQAQTDFKYPKKVDLPGYRPTVEAHAGQVRKACELLAKAKSPVIFAGGGIIISEASEELTRFARLIQAPVTCSLLGLGGYPATTDSGDGQRRPDPLWLGMPGMHGAYQANMAISHADVIFAIGVRFDDRVTGKISTFAPKAKIVHVDIDPTSISKNVEVDVPIVGDCRNALEQCLEFFEKAPIEGISEARTPWLDQVARWKKDHPLTYCPSEELIKPQFVIEKLHEIAGRDAIITTEVGQHQMWTAQFYQFDRPRTLLTSGGLGTMGYGFPAAIGAQVAFPDKLVIDIAGDGSIQMNIQELCTAVCNNIPVKVVIINNTYLGLPRQWQELFYEKNYTGSCMEGSPDFVKLAEAYGAVGLRAERPEQVESVLRQGLAIQGPVFMEFMVATEENVYPIVPPGKSLTEMLLTQL
ncbi:MAG: biosynthetic-type acetolactate synthase large subunit [Syntrophobacteraceae bacterium]|nr:biosynthetic-type acetolactate synthase large subunit [Syntrophobacteraceae bacterium]